MEHVEPHYGLERPTAAEYLGLLQTTGWNELYRVDERMAAELLRGSWVMATARHDSALVGMGRLVSDGALYAVLFDLIVVPELQRRGIGSSLMELLLRQCEDAEIRDVLLFAARHTASFYRRFGFVERASDSPGMLLRQCTGAAR